MSFIYIKNNTGPIADPYGTPDVTRQGKEWLPSIVTFWVRSVRKDCAMHCNKGPLYTFVKNGGGVRVEVLED